MFIRTIILFLLAGTGLGNFAQISSRNGYFIPPYDTINLLFVFAEVTCDPEQNYDSAWLPGQLPGNFEAVIDHKFKGPDHISGWITRLYYKASFGSYIVLGDYLDTLVQIPYGCIEKKGLEECLDFINNLPGDDVITKHGYSFCSDHFDRITSSYNNKRHHLMSDNIIDMLVVMFRTNSRIGDGGSFHIGLPGESLKSKEVRQFILMRSLNNRPDLLSHEIAHLLIGTNQYHTGGSGAGLSNVMSDVGGWGLLSLWNRNSRFANAWDRWWLGWKDKSKQYHISALDGYHKEVSTDFREGCYPVGRDSIFILRDFYSYGDVIRIELPMKRDHTTVPRQYLWIENHVNTKNWEYDKFLPGVRYSIQIGNDDFCNTSTSRTNYYLPLCGFGNYDFRYDVDHVDRNLNVFYNLYTDPGNSNPFTGYHLMLMPAFDLASQMTPGIIFTQEWLSCINTIYFNQEAIPDTIFCDQNHTYLGSACDHFGEGRILSISSNPASVPVLTYNTLKNKNTEPMNFPDTTYDNRSIMLNGLYIEILDIDQDGNARIKVLFNHWNVEDDVRWTGDILLRDTLLLQAGKAITLDQGLTPTRPARPVNIGGEKVFADPTTFICQPGSYLEINDAARFVLKAGSTLRLESGSMIRVRGSGKVLVESSSRIEAEHGASIIMENEAAEMIFMPGSAASICPAKFSGEGKIKGLPTNLYFQDQSLYGTSIHPTWGNIEFNNVILEDHADQIFLAGDAVTIDGPFQTGDDVHLLITSLCPVEN
jgi:hypothetical protein